MTPKAKLPSILVCICMVCGTGPTAEAAKLPKISPGKLPAQLVIQLPTIRVPKVSVPQVRIPEIKLPPIPEVDVQISNFDIPLPELPQSMGKLGGISEQIDLRPLQQTLGRIEQDLAKGLPKLPPLAFPSLIDGLDDADHVLHPDWVDDVVRAWKINGKYLSRDFKGFLRYTQGIWKTIYEKDITLNADHPRIELRQVRNHQNVKIQLRKLTGANVQVTIRSAKSGREVATDAPLSSQQSEFRGVDYPELTLSLVDPQSTGTIHVRCLEHRSTLGDAFGAGTTQNPDELPRVSGSGSPAATSDVTRDELNVLVAEAESQHSAGYYFYLATEEQGPDSGDWYGPYGSESDAQMDMSLYIDFLETVIQEWGPQYYPRSPIEDAPELKEGDRQ